jgi:hypothetical protein
VEKVGTVVNKVHKREGFHDIIIFLVGNIFEMFSLNKETAEKSILFIAYFQLIVILVIKLEVNHLMDAFSIIIPKKITVRKEIGVFSKFRIGKFGLIEVVRVFPEFFLLMRVFGSE